MDFAESFLKAAPRIELGIKDLQSSALPLGHATQHPIKWEKAHPCKIFLSQLCWQQLARRGPTKWVHAVPTKWAQISFCLELAQTGFEPVTLGL